MHEDLLGDENRERLTEIRSGTSGNSSCPFETHQSDSLTQCQLTNSIMQHLKRSKTSVYKMPRPSSSVQLISRYHLPNPCLTHLSLHAHSAPFPTQQALRDIGLELFSDLDALLASRPQDEENPSIEPVQGSNSISDEDLSHAQSLIGPVTEKLLNLNNDTITNDAQGKLSIHTQNPSHSILTLTFSIQP